MHILLKNRILIGACVLIVVGVPCLLILNGQTTSNEERMPKRLLAQSTSIQDSKKDFPVVEYSAERPADEWRRLKNKKYDKYKVLFPEITEDTHETSFADWITSSSPLPTAESELIILGKLVNSEAFLSENKNSVYSEFKIQVEKVFKNINRTAFENDQFIRVEREGGIVTFPSGFKTWYSIAGQKMPKVGSRYLFFLTNEFPVHGRQQKDLYLLTGYELRGGMVSPLDWADGGTHPIVTTYNQKKEAVLLNDLEKSLKNTLPILNNQ